MIEITGNRLLPVSEYLTFTKLDDSSQYYNLNLSMIKERFEKHPYIEKVDVEDLGNQKVKVYLTEKKLEARLLLNGESKFISDKFQVLPILSVAKMVDLPIISNMNINQNVNSLSILKNDEMVQAFKIIDAAKLTNEDLYEKLSEINLQDGGDIHLTLSGIRPTVYFGIGEAAKKMVYLDLMLNGMSNSNSLVDSSEYIDLRFANEIYLGSAEKIGLSE
ncbi:MAG: FtsQ-type POTRA domain-containing protein [Bacteroidetes bacterium]|nr:FtsQ-type POTRA domain-containing protein [Bacteroidota bacterium]